jgi:hypothetical protein
MLLLLLLLMLLLLLLMLLLQLLLLLMLLLLLLKMLHLHGLARDRSTLQPGSRGSPHLPSLIVRALSSHYLCCCCADYLVCELLKLSLIERAPFLTFAGLVVPLQGNIFRNCPLRSSYIGLSL